MSSSWHKQHASALFLGSLFFISVLLLVGGLYLQQQSFLVLSTIGNMLIQLSGAALAASVATAFLGFSDVRDSLAATLARLFSEGAVVDLLSHEVRDELGKRIALRRLKKSARTLEPSLYHHILQISDDCLGVAHIHNYNIRDSLTDHQENPNLLLRKVAISFRVATHHLKSPVAPFPYRFFYQIPLSYLRSLEKDEFVLDFDASLGDHQFSQDDVRINSVLMGGAEFLRFEFEKTITVDHELDAYVNFSALAIRKDSFSVVRARFPTHGFSVSLVNTADQDYDGIWLKSTNSLSEDLPSRKEIRTLPNGISAVTNNWILPGEGVAFSWSPKTTETINVNRNSVESGNNKFDGRK